MLHSYAAATFSPHVGEIFLVRVNETTTLDARLAEVKEAAWASSPQNRRTPFSLYFQTHSATVLPQRIYTLQHPVLGTLELFLVPTSRNGDGVVYEAVFN